MLKPPTKYIPLVLMIGVAIAAVLIWNLTSTTNDESRSDSPSVLVTVEPIAYIVERIAGNSFAVDVLVPSGKEPETFAPNPATVSRFAQNCRVFFRVGLASEETLLAKLTTLAPEMKIVDLRDEILPLHSESRHSENNRTDEPRSDSTTVSEPATNDSPEIHTEEHSCGSDGLDPHIWTSPACVRQMIPTIVARLSEIAPSEAENFARRGSEFDQELAKLQDSIRESLQTIPARIVFVFHPAYGYYCEEFDLEQRAIEVGGKSPKPQDLADFIASARQDGVRTIIVQPEFNRSAAQTVADAANARLEVHSPIEKDYFSNLNRLTTLIVESFQ